MAYKLDGGGSGLWSQRGEMKCKVLQCLSFIGNF